MPFNDYESMKVAAEIVKAVLEGGAIKLIGPGATAEVAPANGKRDAAYLNALISSLEKTLQGK